MGRASTRENKNIYQTTREAMHLTREAAGGLLESIPPERIEKIENERSLPHPDEVLTMAEKYKQPGLCNYYCANQCPIGQEYVPEVKIKDLSQIVLEMLASLNSMNRRKDRLIEITAAGVSKGSALLALAERLGLPASALMACGDGGNDTAMVAAAGLGVAMANAFPEVKAAARYVTATNNEDGVARAVETFVLGKEAL